MKKAIIQNMRWTVMSVVHMQKIVNIGKKERFETFLEQVRKLLSLLILFNNSKFSDTPKIQKGWI